ncbi:MAG: response regulator [Desulfobacterales bacterium]|nr:response regulator [Desulfobacterales bacterium]MDJ0887449.1 response regulator [Desulfobacterales bacterium]
MHSVLLVDDDQTTTVLIARKLKAYCGQFRILTAQDGLEALEQLAQGQIDMVVTDLNMPHMDGFELLTHLNNAYPHIPAVVMTAYNTQEVETHLAEAHQVRVIEKPIDYDALIQSIQRTLKNLGDKCTVKGISLANFLQLIQWEEKSCLLEITDGNGAQGFFFTEEGELIDAVFGSRTGEDAAYAMLAVENPKITINPRPQKKAAQRIHKDLMSILMEGMRLKDEGDEGAPAPEEDDTRDTVSGGIITPPGAGSFPGGPSNGQGVTVLVVDDSKIMRQAIGEGLSRCEGIAAIEEAENGRNAIAINENIRPDVITMDIRMPIMDGLTALKHIMIRQPTAVVMVSTLTRDGAWETFEALRLGAVDFIDKPNRMAGAEIDRQFERLASKVMSARHTNHEDLKLLRPPDGCPPTKTKPPLRGEHGLLVATAAEGGYRAILSILSGMELRESEGFLVTLKSDPAHVDAFAAYLATFSPVPVKRPHVGEPLETGVCYLISARESLSLVGRDNAVVLSAADTAEAPVGQAADRLMASVARIFGPAAAGLILSGNDGDGVEGLRRIKAAGGTTFAPSPEGGLASETIRLAAHHDLVDHAFSHSLVQWHRGIWRR